MRRLTYDDPIRRRFGAFGRFRSRWLTLGWPVALNLAAAGGALVGFSARGTAFVIPAAMALTLACGGLGAIVGTLALPAERVTGTWEPLILTPYPRDLLAHCLLSGALARALSLVAILAVGWAACAFAAGGIGLAGTIAFVLAVLPIATHLGVCLGGDASVKTRTLVGALGRAGLGVGLFLLTLAQASMFWAVLLHAMLPDWAVAFGTVAAIWALWLWAYRRVFFGMLAEYFEPAQE